MYHSGFSVVSGACNFRNSPLLKFSDNADICAECEENYKVVIINVQL